MKSIKQLRKSLGITQRDLAGYLSISRSQLSMIETGRASISTPALLRLTVIQQVMMGNAPAGYIEPDTGRLAKTNKMLRMHAQRHDWMATTATRRLEAMRIQYRQCTAVLQITAVLLNEPATGREAKKARLCLEIMQRGARKKMNACGMEAQVRLQLKADVFSYQAKRAREMMG